MAELFQTTPQNVTQHLKAIYGEGELQQAATRKDFLQVRQEGNRQVRRTVRHYSLDAILSVGYRVRSPGAALSSVAQAVLAARPEPPAGLRSPRQVRARSAPSWRPYRLPSYARPASWMTQEPAFTREG